MEKENKNIIVSLERSPEEIIDELEFTEESISVKETELSLLKRKLTKLNIELAEATNPNKY